MKQINPFLNFIALFFLLLFSGIVFAQDKSGDNFAPEEKTQGVRQNFLRELGLDREQIRQIRMLNAKRTPLMKEAQKTLRQANRYLDEAIYADSIDEKLIQTRLQEVQTAQAEVFKIRAMNEVEVRKLLTPEQLTKFRELREQFAERVKNNQQRIQNRIQDSQKRKMQNKTDVPPNEMQLR
jgi:Spy/CpxP family protein refolding chaperone